MFTKNQLENAELSDLQSVKVGDLVVFEGRYSMYNDGVERWVIQLTPTTGLVVNIESNLFTIFTGECWCVVDAHQQGVKLKIVSKVYE